MDHLVSGETDKVSEPRKHMASQLSAVHLTLQPKRLVGRCRHMLGCNTWFWCGEPRGGKCHDWQSRLTVNSKGCLLLTADTRPQPMPKRQDITDQFRFFSYHVGHIKSRFTTLAIRSERLFGRNPALTYGGTRRTLSTEADRNECALVSVGIYFACGNV